MRELTRNQVEILSSYLIKSNLFTQNEKDDVWSTKRTNEWKDLEMERKEWNAQIPWQFSISNYPLVYILHFWRKLKEYTKSDCVNKGRPLILERYARPITIITIYQ